MIGGGVTLDRSRRLALVPQCNTLISKSYHSQEILQARHSQANENKPILGHSSWIRWALSCFGVCRLVGLLCCYFLSYEGSWLLINNTMDALSHWTLVIHCMLSIEGDTLSRLFQGHVGIHVVSAAFELWLHYYSLASYSHWSRAITIAINVLQAGKLNGFQKKIDSVGSSILLLFLVIFSLRLVVSISHAYYSSSSEHLQAS